MKTNFVYIWVASILFIVINGCTIAEQKKPDIRPFEFDGFGLKVITSLSNDRLNTMSILYGNEPALNYSINKKSGLLTAVIFKLVTYEQQDHEFWYGSKINGALKKVETIKFLQENNKVIPAYNIEYFNTAKVGGTPDQESKRIAFILGQMPSLFPR